MRARERDRQTDRQTDRQSTTVKTPVNIVVQSPDVMITSKIYRCMYT